MAFKVCVGLDVSLTGTGVAVITEPFKAEYFTFGYSLKKTSTHLDRLERVVWIASQVTKVIKTYQPHQIGLENYGFASKGPLTMIADVTGTIKSQIYIMGKMPIILAAGTIRNYLSVRQRKGTDIKELVRESLEALGYSGFGDDNQSDALAVAHVVNAWTNEKRGGLQPEKLEIFDGIERHLRRTTKLCKLKTKGEEK